MKVGENLLAETCADVADGLVILCVRVVAGEQKCSVPACALSTSVIRAKDDEVKGITHSGEIVLLHFQPVL